MGAWGTGNFENDDAADWIAELEESKTIQPLVSALQSAVGADYLEAPEACVALVAAEVVAALKGKPAAGLPREAASWVRSHQVQINDDLVRLALQATQRVETQSELLELWQESEELNSWMATIKDLERRLGVA